MSEPCKVNLFLLAAGLGTRLRPITNKYPKPCVPFLNVPLGLYQMRFLNQLKIQSFVVNSFYLPEQIKNLFDKQPYYKNKISISDENTNATSANLNPEYKIILGSAGGLKKAAELFTSEEVILMMNADEVFFTSNPLFLQNAYRQHIEHGNLATLVVMKHPEAGKKFGAIWVDDKTVRHIGKTNIDPNLTPYHYVGIILLNKKILDLIPSEKESNIFYDILIHELKNNAVEIYNLDSCNWYETGNGNDYFLATEEVLSLITSNQATDLMNFINSYDPSHLVKNEGGFSLVSDSIKINEKKLFGFNVISGSTNTSLLNSLTNIQNSILFENEIINRGCFS